MQTPWMNDKKMQEIISKQNNCICSSKVYIRSISPERYSRQIYIMNSSGVQLKLINQYLIRENIEDLENKGSQISSVKTGVDQKAKQVKKKQKDAITDLPKLQIDVAEEESSGSITISNQDLMNDLESSTLNESSVDHEENLESSAKMEVDYFSNIDQSDENQMNDSQSTISGETDKVFEDTQEFFETGGINFASMLDPHFKNIRVPVVLGEYNLECCVEEVISFKEKVKRINEIYNKVILTNCKVIPTQLSPVLENGTCKASEAYLYFEGFIDQTIDYLSLTNGDLSTMRKKTPFTIAVKINDFLHPPIFGSIAQTTFEFIDPNNTQISQLDTQLFHSTIYYPEQPYCQMISSKIHQIIYLRGPVNGTKNQSDRTIVGPKKIQLNQKIVVEIFVHLLQIQSIRVKSDDY